MEAANAHDMSTAPPSAATPHSPWHSPVPYLFGGLAAMLGLIAFALLILACSYWKLSGYLDGGRQDGTAGEGDVDVEAGTGDGRKPVFEEKILVVMAGEVKPTFLAIPLSSRSSSFGDGNTNCSSGADKSEKPEVAVEKNAPKQQSSDQHQQSL
ncbi:protein GLUTAMINE DUMPER 2-like [Punica granatum]|uniref:Uncharacterized protein n=2 Tax=Punica granatum TaxID=22663 RepID=A0A218XWA0_PUNGR|nr:protein GLUTAMINE DUMPER 2-like [Punica granatum]OWM89253.1 hypothetical protein CDL15_Pgr010540 [Punica granatum]PKI59865.1 hypothetical protein CRG98_019747 [Punica granatum]